MSDRDEWRSALMPDHRAEHPAPTTGCYHHAMRPNRSGGGTCVACGETVNRGEL